MDSKLDTLAARVKHARVTAGFKSHAALAAKIGENVKPQTIQSIESGRTRRSRLLPQIAVATGFNVQWLIHKEGPERDLRAQDSGTRSKYVELSDEALDIAYAWSRLPPERAAVFRNLIFYDAVVTRLMPWLRDGRPSSERYDQFERQVVADYERHQQHQLGLFDADATP